MSAHTPGPWKVEDDGREVVVYAVEGSCRVASIELDNLDDRSHALRDARLIAAAPDLLAALKLVEFGNAVTHHKCVACAGWNMGPNGETPRQHTHDCPVRIAIAKAEGKS